VAGDLHFGWSMLVQYILPSGAVAGLVTYFAGWRLSFGEYLATLPWLLQAGFFVCLFVVTFGLINRLIAWGIRRYREGDLPSGVPTIGHASNVYLNQPPATQANEEKKGAGPDFPDTKEWRSVIHDFDLDSQSDRRSFLRTDTYSQMKQYLKPEVIDMFEAQRTLHVGNEARGVTAYHYTLLDEVDRIERERVLNAPKPITNQAAPGELKALCFHLADELEHEELLYKDREEAIQIWIPQLEYEGLSENEIDEKVSAARDDNLVGTLDRYNKHLKDRLLKLYDTLGPQGWLGAVDRNRFENLYDPYDMRRIAKRLRGIGDKLPEG
jgi:hypothetical protein